MFTFDQRQYLEEVLGMNSAGMALAAEQAPAAYSNGDANLSTDIQHHNLLVLSYKLNDDERALLTKILGSVKLGGFMHFEQEKISLAEFPQGITATNVLAFIDYPPGKNSFADSTWFVLPPVAQMIGATAAVVSRKKETWNLVQQFAKEYA